MIKFNGPANYKIIVQGTLPEKFMYCFEGLEIVTVKDKSHKCCTVINTRIKDQAELSGMINTLYEWGYPILLVECEGKIVNEYWSAEHKPIMNLKRKP